MLSPNSCRSKKRTRLAEPRSPHVITRPAYMYSTGMPPLLYIAGYLSWSVRLSLPIPRLALGAASRGSAILCAVPTMLHSRSTPSRRHQNREAPRQVRHQPCDPIRPWAMGHGSCFLSLMGTKVPYALVDMGCPPVDLMMSHYAPTGLPSVRHRSVRQRAHTLCGSGSPPSPGHRGRGERVIE